LRRVLEGDFGQSFNYHRPVLEMIGSARPNTLPNALHW
jgi:ABC-type dipeptide/oligopeptide/nickel transport system permease component